MALYQNGILISGANQLPQMTMAEYLAIPASDRPTYWVCTDRDYSDLSAENVIMSDGVTSVESAIGLLNMRKVADSISTGTYRSKLQSLATAYNTLSGIQRLKCVLTLNDTDIFFPVNIGGAFFTVYISSTNALNLVYSISGDAYLCDNGNISDLSTMENNNVFSLWVSQ